MSWFTGLFTSGASSLIDSIASVADRFIETPEEKKALLIEVETLVQQRDSELQQSLRQELEAKERVLVAELNQSDTYTKRARPTVVYAGLAFICINYVLVPLLARMLGFFGVEGVDVSPLTDLPADFWLAWGGICATWSIGRTFEKRGSSNAGSRAITGSKQFSKLLD